jgi:hypothetical protein
MTSLYRFGYGANYHSNFASTGFSEFVQPRSNIFDRAGLKAAPPGYYPDAQKRRKGLLRATKGVRRAMPFFLLAVLGWAMAMSVVFMMRL